MFLGKCLREETSGETAGRREGKGKEGGGTSGETAGRKEGKEKEEKRKEES